MAVPDHEIIVAGAGPAGSVAAAFLARTGRDVLLIDRHAFPRDKVCGDAVGPFAIRILHEIELKNAVDRAGFHAIDSARIVAPDGADIRIRFSENRSDGVRTWIAPRKRLDDLIQKQAVQFGAVFLHAKVLDIWNTDDGNVRLKVRTGHGEETRTCRLLLAADGSGSVIARKLNGLHPMSRTAVAARAYVRGIRTLGPTIEGFLDPSVWPGYGWIFPAGPNAANVGVGLSLKAFRKRRVSLKHLFNDFLSAPEIRERLSPDMRVEPVSGWPLHLGWANRFRRVGNRVILLGDAAGLVNPLSGGGIANAVFSGKLAAETAAGALERNDFSEKSLSEYVQRLKRVVRRELIVSGWLRRLIYISPAWVNGSMRLMRSQPILPALLSRMYPDLRFDCESEESSRVVKRRAK